jgi:hypothetical protein
MYGKVAIDQSPPFRSSTAMCGSAVNPKPEE